MTVIRPSGTGWCLSAPRPVGEVGTLPARLLAEADGTAVALGVDLPIGLPRAYAATRPEPTFRQFLQALHSMPDFFSVCASLAELRPERPFYPNRGVAGMTRLSHALALGFPDAMALSRHCDRATLERPAGAPLFWTLGANQTGKAAINAWRHLILPAIVSCPPLRLWPFDGPLRALLAPGTVTVAETYPAEALRHLNTRLIGSKRRQGDRAAIAPLLLAAAERLGAVPDHLARRTILDGFGADATGEDRFDSTIGALCVLNVVLGNRSDEAPDDPWIRHWEGWVLGQTAAPRVKVVA